MNRRRTRWCPAFRRRVNVEYWSAGVVARVDVPSSAFSRNDAVAARDHLPIVSFDRDFDKFKGIRRVEPKP